MTIKMYHHCSCWGSRANLENLARPLFKENLLRTTCCRIFLSTPSPFKTNKQRILFQVTFMLSKHSRKLSWKTYRQGQLKNSSTKKEQKCLWTADNICFTVPEQWEKAKTIENPLGPDSMHQKKMPFTVNTQATDPKAWTEKKILNFF